MPDLLRPTPAQALDQLAFIAICLEIGPSRISFNPLRYSCLCCGAKGGYDTMIHGQTCPLRVLREVVAELDVTPCAVPPSIEIPAPYAVGTRVRWCAGRTQRESTGLIEAVHQEEGWPAEYDVRVLWKDGRPGVQVLRRYHSELERLPDAPTS